MLIKEVEKQLNISSYTLRYYEKMGLIHPYRDHNGYRNYTHQDIVTLKKIRFLRELEIPIEDIQLIINGQSHFQDVLNRHMQKLDTQMKSLQCVKDICTDLKEKDIPLLDAIIDDHIINEEKINQKEIKNSLKKIFDYIKPVKTIVIGCRISTRDYVIGLIENIFLSLFIGSMITIGVPNLMNYMNQQLTHAKKGMRMPTFQPSFVLFIVITMIIYLIFAILLALSYGKQDYIELLDNHLSICSYRYQNRLLITKSLFTKKENPHHIRYTWNECQYVEIKLYFQMMSGGKSGLWTIYVPEFTFHFQDGFQYHISSGISMGDDAKTAYQILRNKNIDIVTSDEMIDYFEQNEISGYDYFEKIYHKNEQR